MTARNKNGGAKGARSVRNVRARHHQRKPASTTSRPASAAPESASVSPEVIALVADGSGYLETGNFDAAVTAYERASALAPQNAEVLSSYAEALIEAGQPEGAEAALRKSIELAPNTGFEKYMYLAQLLGNTMDAVSISRKGVEVMRRERSTASGGNAARQEELSGYEVSALCGIAEVLLGVIEESQDQAVAERLDRDVELAVGEALAVCKEGTAGEMEASMALANLRLSQGRVHDARLAMQRVVSTMQQGLDALEAGGGGDESIIDGLSKLPPLEIRVAIGKQLAEVSLWEDAVRVLSSTMWECDFNIEVWCMLALAYHNLSEREDALEAVASARRAVENPDGYVGIMEDGMFDQLEAFIRGGSGAGDSSNRANCRGDGDDKMRD
jgi:tetratricopeptide (TPR) repeat protein